MAAPRFATKEIEELFTEVLVLIGEKGLINELENIKYHALSLDDTKDSQNV